LAFLPISLGERAETPARQPRARTTVAHQSRRRA
jgi:hypothetical protein